MNTGDRPSHFLVMFEGRSLNLFPKDGSFLFPGVGLGTVNLLIQYLPQLELLF